MGPKQIVKPKSSCYHAGSLSLLLDHSSSSSAISRPSSPTLPLSHSHDRLMNVDSALGDAVVLLQGLCVHAVSSACSSQAMVKGSIALAKPPLQ